VSRLDDVTAPSPGLLAAGECRYRLLRITPELLLALTLNPRREGDRIDALTVEGLPADVYAEAVWYDHDRDCFCLRIAHPTFDVVLEGCLPPEAFVSVRRETLRVAGTQRGREFI